MERIMFKKMTLSWLIVISAISALFASDLTVLSYNANLLPNIPISDLTKNLNHPFKRAYYIPKKINKLNVDVVAFQEDIAPISSAILNAQMKKYGFIYKTKVVGQPSWEHINLLNGGVIIYSKYPFAGSPQYLVFPRSYGVEGISNKGAVFVSINKDNKRYNIISLHTQSLSFPQYTTEEYTHWKNQIGALNQFIANLQLPANEPLIVLGDFNADSGKAIKGQAPQSKDHPIYAELLRILNATAASVYGPETLPFSYDATTNTMIDSSEQTTLDHILCIQGYLCANEHSSTSIIALKSKQLKGKPDLSDHYAVIAKLNFDVK